MFQVANMIGYAVGEVVDGGLQSSSSEEREEREENEREPERWRPHHNRDGSYYEVVTAWVHPRYYNVCSSAIIRHV